MRLPVLLIILTGSIMLRCQSASTSSDKTANEVSRLSAEETKIWAANHADSILVRHRFDASNGMQMPYRLFTPEVSDQKVPLVIFLHGRGDRGTDNGPQTYQRVGLFMNENSLIGPNMQADYPCYVLVPQCSDKTINEEWAKWEGNSPETPFKGLGKDGSYQMNPVPSESGAAALELIEHIMDSKPVDKERIYLVGLSMGGFGTWEFTARRPDLFAAAVPMAGFSDPDQIEKIKHIPFWIFHGGADEANPVEGSRNMYSLLKTAGADVQYTEYPEADHGTSFKLAFQEEQLIPWMFAQRKEPGSR